MERLKYVFSTSLLIHIALAGIIFILAETAGVWFLNTQMTIPSARLHAANWVFQASVLSFMSGLFSVPYNASIVSHERMSAFAYIGILDVLLRLFIVLFITYISWNFDRLIVYSLLLAAVSIVLQCIYILYCRKNFAECRLRICFDRSCWVEMSSFAGWNFIGGTASLLKTQGVNVLLNLFVGPVLNAARGIAGSVNTVVCSFANNFMTALRPQITKSYASGNYSYMMSLVERGARFSFYTIFILTLPVLFETDFILTLWLTQYPEHTVNFIRLVLLASLCDVLSNTLITLQAATGKIRNYQLAVGGMLIMNFPLSYLCLKFGFPPGVHFGRCPVCFCMLSGIETFLFAFCGRVFRKTVFEKCLCECLACLSHCHHYSCICLFSNAGRLGAFYYREPDLHPECGHHSLPDRMYSFGTAIYFKQDYCHKN